MRYVVLAVSTFMWGQLSVAEITSRGVCIGEKEAAYGVRACGGFLKSEGSFSVCIGKLNSEYGNGCDSSLSGPVEQDICVALQAAADANGCSGLSGLPQQVCLGQMASKSANGCSGLSGLERRFCLGVQASSYANGCENL